MSTDTIDNRFMDIPKSALIFSVGLHLCAPLLLVGLQIITDGGLFPSWKNRNPPKQAYQNFIQVDVVGLPDNLISEKKNVDVSLPIVDKAGETKDVAKPVVPEAAKDDVLAVPEKELSKETAKENIAAKRKAEERAAAEKEKTRQKEQEVALKRLQEEAARDAAVRSLKDKAGTQGRQKIAGNITSKGTSMTGMIGNASDQYVARLKAAIEQQFSYYPWQKKKNLLNRVYLEIFPNGRAKLRTIVKPSGDKVFDSAVLAAVDAAQPLPVPEDLSILSDGIEIEFKPEAK